MKKDNWKNKLKKMMVVAMMVCMLFAITEANSNMGIMPCTEFYDEIEKL